MRYFEALTDTEIISWNDRLKNLRYTGVQFLIAPVSNSSSSYPSIEFRNIDRFATEPWGRSLRPANLESIVQNFEYDVVFSISIDKEELFNEIYDRVRVEKILNLLVIEDKQRKLDESKFLNVDLKKIKHSLFNNEYIRYEYKLKGHLAEIMGYVKSIDDTIAFLKIKPKYKINHVVSIKEDKSKDFVIINYLYNKENTKYEILYLLREILSDDDIVTYGISTTFSENMVCNSRTSIITDLEKDSN